MSLGLDLSNSEAKIARANEHLKALQAEVEEINRKRNPYAIRLDRHGKSSSYSLVLYRAEFHEPRLGIILGDAVHNLRCALDYVVVALAEKGGAALTSSHQFPISDDSGDYVTKARRMLNGISFGRREIERLQPYHEATPSHNPLFVINYFSNADKHRIISNYVPVLEKLSPGAMTPAPASVKQFKPSNYLRQNQEFEIARVTFAVVPREIHFKGQITVSIYFGTPAFGKRQKGLGVPVGFFKNASDHVAMIVDGFRAL